MRKDDSTLRDLFVLGRLGPFRGGLAPENVRSLLGAPGDTSVTRNPMIWTYGSLQVAFLRDMNRDVLGFIGLYFREGELDLPSSIEFEGWRPTCAASPKEVMQFAITEGIACVLNRQLTWEDQLSLTIGGIGVGVHFDRQETGTMRLDSIQFLARVMSAHSST